MFGLMRVGDSGDYQDVIKDQFSKITGSVRGNPEAEAKINTMEYRQQQLYKYFKTVAIDRFRAEAVLAISEADPALQNYLQQIVQQVILEKAQKIAQSEMEKEQPEDFIGKQLRTYENIVAEWVRFLRSEMSEEIKQEAAQRLYGHAGNYKGLIDQVTEQKILERVEEKAISTDIEERRAASRAAILGAFKP